MKTNQRQKILILMTMPLVCTPTFAQNVQDTQGAQGSYVVESNPSMYRGLQGGVGIAEIIAVAGVFKVKQRAQELKVARDALKQSNDRLNKLRLSYRALSPNSRAGLESRLQYLLERLKQLQEYLNTQNLGTEAREEIAQMQESIVQKNVGLMRLEGTHQKTEMEALTKEIDVLQRSLRERLKTELSADPFVLKVQIDEIQREVGEIREALRKGSVAGTPIASFDAEAAAIARQIVTTERLVQADAERVSAVVKRLRSRGIFRRLKATPFVTLIGDAILIADALPRMGYLLTISEDPGYIGVDNSIITVKEVLFDRAGPRPLLPQEPSPPPASPPK